MIVYVAGGRSERVSVCRPMIDALRAAGIEVAYDWTRDPGWDDPAQHDALRAARADLRALLRAHVLWYVAPADRSEGSHAELGAALAAGIYVVASGETLGADGRIFPQLAHEVYASHALALDRVVALARLGIDAAGAREPVVVTRGSAWAEAVREAEEDAAAWRRRATMRRDCGQPGPVCAARAPGCQSHLVERARELVAERDTAIRERDEARATCIILEMLVASCPSCSRAQEAR